MLPNLKNVHIEDMVEYHTENPLSHASYSPITEFGIHLRDQKSKDIEPNLIEDDYHDPSSPLSLQNISLFSSKKLINFFCQLPRETTLKPTDHTKVVDLPAPWNIGYLPQTLSFADFEDGILNRCVESKPVEVIEIGSSQKSNGIFSVKPLAVVFISDASKNRIIWKIIAISESEYALDLVESKLKLIVEEVFRWLKRKHVQFKDKKSIKGKWMNAKQALSMVKDSHKIWKMFQTENLNSNTNEMFMELEKLKLQTILNQKGMKIAVKDNDQSKENDVHSSAIHFIKRFNVFSPIRPSQKNEKKMKKANKINNDNEYSKQTCINDLSVCMHDKDLDISESDNVYISCLSPFSACSKSDYLNKMDSFKKREIGNIRLPISFPSTSTFSSSNASPATIYSLQTSNAVTPESSLHRTASPEPSSHKPTSPEPESMSSNATILPVTTQDRIESRPEEAQLETRPEEVQLETRLTEDLSFTQNEPTMSNQDTSTNLHEGLEGECSKLEYELDNSLPNQSMDVEKGGSSTLRGQRRWRLLKTVLSFALRNDLVFKEGGDELQSGSTSNEMINTVFDIDVVGDDKSGKGDENESNFEVDQLPLCESTLPSSLSCTPSSSSSSSYNFKSNNISFNNGRRPPILKEECEKVKKSKRKKSVSFSGFIDVRYFLSEDDHFKEEQQEAMAYNPILERQNSIRSIFDENENENDDDLLSVFLDMDTELFES